MEHSDKMMTPEQSLEIIKKSIEQSRKDMVKLAGSPMLLWGGLVFIFSLLIYFLWNKSNNPSWNFLWFVMTAVGSIAGNYLPGNKSPKVESFVSVVLGKVWLSFGIFAISASTLCILCQKLILLCFPELASPETFNFPITLIITALLGMASTATGFILKNGWISAAGIICGIVGTAFAMVLRGPAESLLLTSISVIALIIPGFMVNAQTKRNG